MGVHDYISYIRRNGQNLCEYEFENSYLSYISEDYDECNASNLDINYNLLSNAINSINSIDEANDIYGSKCGYNTCISKRNA